jgi:hypothetical protein
MEKLRVSYELALLAKEKGFDEPCFGLFVRKGNSFLLKEMPNQQECEQFFGGILAPIYQQLLDWLEAEHNIFVEVTYGKDSNSVWYNWDIYSLIKPRKDDETGDVGEVFETDIDEKFLNYETSYDSMVEPMYELFNKEACSTKYAAYEAAIIYCLTNLI